MKTTNRMKINIGLLFCAALLLAFGGPGAQAATEDFKLSALDGAADDEFGDAVSVDGDTAVVGAPRDDVNGLVDAGSVYVFVRHGGGWALQAKLTASDAGQDDFFGYSVSISGERILIGAHLDNDGGTDSGSAYVFSRTNGVWTQEDKLGPTFPSATDFFGRSVSLSGDTALIGTTGDDDIGSNSGAAYVFVRAGSVWFEEEKIIGADTAPGDQFGWSVSVSNGTGLIGVPNDVGVGSNSGSAYVFIDNGSNWSQQSKLVGSDTASGDFFGMSVSIFQDTAMVGADGDDVGGNNTGSAYFFTRNITTWTQEDKIGASDPEAFDAFGGTVAVYADRAIVGVSASNDAGGFSGSAYVFSRNAGDWTQDDKLLASDAAGADQFGYRVAMTDGTAIAGAFGTDDLGLSSGSAYVFDLTPPYVLEDPSIHDADQDADNIINLTELLRVIQFFNVFGYYYCPADATEDGFCPGP